MPTFLTFQGSGFASPGNLIPTSTTASGFNNFSTLGWSGSVNFSFSNAASTYYLSTSASGFGNFTNAGGFGTF